MKTLIVFLIVSATVWAQAKSPQKLSEKTTNEIKQMAQTCFACHGENGVSNNPVWPNLKGQKKQYMVLQLKAFYSGQRQHPVMSPIAKAMSQEEMEKISLYYSEL